MTAGGRGGRVLAVVALASLAGCSFVAGYPDTSDERSQDACHDGTDNDLDGAPDCVDDECEEFCPGEDDIAPARLTDCFDEEGFAFEVQEDKEQRLFCEPFPGDSCEEAQVALPGAAGCSSVVRFGCDADPVPAGAIHVRPGAAGGDGSPDSPYGSIAEALDAAGAGDVVALDAGSYSEAAVVDEAVTLVGSCSGTSRIEPDGTTPALRIATGGVTVRRVAVAAGGRPGLAVEGASDVVLEGVRVESATREGIRLEGGSVAAERIVVDAVSGDGSAGIRVRGGAALQMTGALVRGSAVGIDVAGAQAMLKAVAVDGSSANGISIGEGGGAILAGTVVRNAGGSSVAVDCRSAGADCLTMRQSVLRGRKSGGGKGIVMRSGAATVTKTEVSGATGHGLLLDGAIAELVDVVIQGTRQSDTATGIGLEVRGGSMVSGEKIELRANLNRGLLVHGAGSRIEVHDLSVLANLGVTTRGIGIEVRDAALVLFGFHVFRAGRCGIAIRGDGPLSLSTGVIDRGSAGVCVYPDADVSVSQLTSQVTYRNTEPISVE